MELIVLEGKTNVGKTSTLNVLYHLLLHDGYVPVPGYFIDYGGEKDEDFRDVLGKDGKKIGIVTLGDYVRGDKSVKNLLILLQPFDCNLVVCARTSDKAEMERQFETFTIIKTFHKTPNEASAQRLDDYAVALDIVSAIKNNINL